MAKAKTEVKKPDPKKGEPSTAVVPQGRKLGDGGALILQHDKVPDHIKQDSQRGSENVGMEDLVIPRLEIVQALSPAVTEGDPGFVPGAKQGDLINSVTNQVYGKEVFVVPVDYSKQWLIWIDRKAGGGFRGAYPNPQEADERIAAIRKEEPQLAEAIQSIDTPTHFCLIVDRNTGTVDEIVMSMPRTKAKISRNWNSMVRLAGGDRFSRVYRVTTNSEKNAKGTFWNYAIAQSGFPAKVLYERAEKLFTQIKAGQKNVVMDVSGYNPGESGGEDGHESGM